MAYIVMASVRADRLVAASTCYALYRYGLYRDGIYSYGL